MNLPENKHSLSILYIEDNHQNQRLVSTIISSKTQHTLYLADNGQDGITAASTYLPDLILLDINLPDISGYDVIKILKNNQQTSSTPVIAITANATPSDYERARDEGFANYITKPFNISEFLDIINSFVK